MNNTIIPDTLTSNHQVIESTIRRAIQISKELRENLTFNMSLSGKEIFHTNFISHILEQESKPGQLIHEFKKNLINLIFDIDIDIDENKYKIYTYREKSNIDLIIVLNDGKNNIFAAIEFKLKSIPDQDQLINYTRKIYNGIKLDEGLLMKESSNGTIKPNVHKVLISPIKPNIQVDNWSHLCFKSIINIGTESLVQRGGIYDLVIDDYVKSTALLLDSINLIIEATSQFLSDPKSCINLNSLHDIINKFRPARIHDLIGKQCYSTLAQHFKEKLAQEPCLTLIPEYCKLNAGAFFSNSTPGLGIYFKCHLKEDISIGFQIQNDTIRRFFEYPKSKTSLVKQIGDATNKWMSGDDYLGLNRDTSVYRSFDLNKFIYKQKSINTVSNKINSFEGIYEECLKSLSAALDLIKEENLLKKLD